MMAPRSSELQATDNKYETLVPANTYVNKPRAEKNSHSQKKNERSKFPSSEPNYRLTIFLGISVLPGSSGCTKADIDAILI